MSVELHLLQDNIFDQAKFRARLRVRSLRSDRDVLKQWLDAVAPVVADEMEAAVARS